MRLREALIGLIWIVGTAGACGTVSPPAPIGAPPSTCAEACQHSDTAPPGGLGCQNGGACMTVCQMADDPAYAGCILASTSCAQVDACGLSEPDTQTPPAL